MDLVIVFGSQNAPLYILVCESSTFQVNADTDVVYLSFALFNFLL